MGEQSVGNGAPWRMPSKEFFLKCVFFLLSAFWVLDMTLKEIMMRKVREVLG